MIISEEVLHNADSRIAKNRGGQLVKNTSYWRRQCVELEKEVNRLKADISSLAQEFDSQHKLVASRYVAERLMTLRNEWDTKDKPKPPPLLEDGYGSAWVNYCYRCKDATLEIVRPGRVQCHKCGR